MFSYPHFLKIHIFIPQFYPLSTDLWLQTLLSNIKSLMFIEHSMHQALCKVLYSQYLIYSSQHRWIGTIILIDRYYAIPVVLIRKMKPREVNLPKGTHLGCGRAESKHRTF